MIYEKDINMLHQEIPPQGARPGTITGAPFLASCAYAARGGCARRSL